MARPGAVVLAIRAVIPVISGFALELLGGVEQLGRSPGDQVEVELPRGERRTLRVLTVVPAFGREAEAAGAIA